ncbi:polysaccharide pyruvyl transferase family protein [Metapseudomonas furukawaii]|jgi:hypothetical protein
MSGLIQDSRPTLIGYLPPLEGIRKTGANYPLHAQYINIGDIAYAHAGAQLTSGRHFTAWNFSMSAEEVNEKFSKVVFYVPCRIAPPPFDGDGYPYKMATRFIEGLKIPFFSLGESVQTRDYDYDPSLHRSLSPEVVRYLEVIADKSPIVGTRGEFSAEVLRKLGISNAVPLGCPSLYLNGPELRGSLLDVPAAPERVAVCYSNYQGNRHSRIADVMRMAEQAGYHYIEQAFGLITQALFYPGKITGADIHNARKTYQDLGPLLSLLRQQRVRYFTNYALWKDFMGSFDFAFGARMHGLTPAIHAGKPAVFIAHDARVREMCEFFSLPFVAERDLPRTLTLDFFLERCDYSIVMPRYQAAYRDLVQTLRRHGLADNIDGSGQIIDAWSPEPDAQVALEEGHVQCSAQELENLQRQIELCAGIPDAVFERLEQVRAISQNWFLSRSGRGGQ